MKFKRGTRFSESLKWVGVGCFVALMGGCQTPRQRIVNRENDLAAAGFLQRPADTAERKLLLAQLPAHHFVQRQKNEKVRYVYADPSICRCLYIGSEAAYSQYRQNVESRAAIKQVEDAMKQQNNDAADADFDAEIYDNPAYRWDAWGPWEW